MVKNVLKNGVYYTVYGSQFETPVPVGQAEPVATPEKEPGLISPAALAAALNGDLANALVAATPGGIERQEAEGQRKLVASTILPKEIQNATRQDLERDLGFKFGKVEDDLFVNVHMPEGWHKKSTSHAMWSDLVDPQGRRRGGIFYKAAFYDLKAHMYLTSRFTIDGYSDAPEGEPHRIVAVIDTTTGEPVFLAGTYDSSKSKYWEQKDELNEKAINWLKEFYPDYTNPFAYW